MVCENMGTPCYVFKSDANKVYLAVFFEFMAYAEAAIPISRTVDVNDLGEMGDFMAIGALVYIILRIIVVILILMGNKNENLRLLWLGFVGQRITIVITVLLGLIALLIWGHVLLSLQIFLSLSIFSFVLIFVVGKRIEGIKIHSDAETNTA